MTHKLFGLAAAAAVSLSLLTGCPAEEKKNETTTTTTTTTEGSPAAASAAPTAGTTATASSAPANKMAAASTIDAKAIFAQKCSGCHGANGGGGMGPALGNVEAKGDAFIKNRITNGSPEKGMPPFGAQLKPAEIDALVQYVKSL